MNAPTAENPRSYIGGDEMEYKVMYSRGKKGFIRETNTLEKALKIAQEKHAQGSTVTILHNMEYLHSWFAGEPFTYFEA